MVPTFASRQLPATAVPHVNRVLAPSLEDASLWEGDGYSEYLNSKEFPGSVPPPNLTVAQPAIEDLTDKLRIRQEKMFKNEQALSAGSEPTSQYLSRVSGVGIIAGVCVFVALSIFITLYIMRRRYNKRQQRLVDEERAGVELASIDVGPKPRSNESAERIMTKLKGRFNQAALERAQRDGRYASPYGEQYSHDPTLRELQKDKIAALKRGDHNTADNIRYQINAISAHRYEQNNRRNSVPENDSQLKFELAKTEQREDSFPVRREAIPMPHLPKKSRVTDLPKDLNVMRAQF